MPSTSTCARAASSAPSGCSRASPTASRWRRCSAIASSAHCATPECRSSCSSAGAPFRCGLPEPTAQRRAARGDRGATSSTAFASMDAYRNARRHLRRTACRRRSPTPVARSPVLIEDLLDQMDSVSDLLVAESVHRMVGGSMEGAGAAMLTLDKQTRPPDTQVVATPHATRGYTSVSSSRSSPATPGRGPISAPRISPHASSRASTPGWRDCSAIRRSTSSSPRCWCRRRHRAIRGSTTARPWSPASPSSASAACSGAAERGAARQRPEGAGADRDRARRRCAPTPAPPPTQMAVLLQRDAQTPGRIGLVGFEAFARSCAACSR